MQNYILLIFSGKMLEDENKLLHEFGIYKECTVQLMLKKALSPLDIINASTIKMIRERRLKRQEDIQIGKPKSEYVQIGIYHYDSNNQNQKPKSYGSFSLKVQDLPRNKQIDHFCKLDSGTGEVFCSIRRAPIVSPDLAITLKVKLIIFFIFLDIFTQIRI